jgi:hypothetical protein
MNSTTQTKLGLERIVVDGKVLITVNVIFPSPELAATLKGLGYNQGATGMEHHWHVRVRTAQELDAVRGPIASLFNSKGEFIG